MLIIKSKYIPIAWLNSSKNKNENRRKCKAHRQMKLCQYRLKTQIHQQQMMNRVSSHRNRNLLSRMNRWMNRCTQIWNNQNKIKTLTSCQKQLRSPCRLHQLQQQRKSQVNKGIPFSLRMIQEQMCTTKTLMCHKTKLYMHAECTSRMSMHHLRTLKNE